MAALRGQAADVGMQQPGLALSASPEVRLVGHEHRDLVEHGFQTCFELGCPAVLGEPGRQAVHRREMPGVDLGRRVDQRERAVGVLDRLPLLSRARRAQAAENRIGGRSPAGSAPSPEALSVPANDPSPGLGSRSVMALVSSSR